MSPEFYDAGEAGRYVLLVDRYTSPTNHREYRKGAELRLDAAEATRLGNADAIAKAEARLGEGAS